MKVIIDISKELFENVIDHIKRGYVGSDVWIAVANGKPYEERPQGEWIPVSERLPEEDGEYLVTRKTCTNSDMVFVRDIASFTINHRLNNGFHKANTVIAWQPLPEPYKEGGAK